MRAANQGAMLRWLKKRSMRLPAGPLTAAQEADIADCFNMLDADGSGTLEVKELVKAFKMLGLKVMELKMESCTSFAEREGQKIPAGLLLAAQVCIAFDQNFYPVAGLTGDTGLRQRDDEASSG